MTSRCIAGRIWEHQPFPDDPDREVDVGPCPMIGECDCECAEPKEEPE